MSFRPQGRFTVDPTSPRARGACDRCGAHYQLDQLKWQFQYAGARLQNLRILVCRSCMDVPQQQLRAIIIPADPLPVMNPRPENYVQDNNPISGIGQNANPALAGTNIGTLTWGGGTYSAFDSNTNKPFQFCAYIGVSGSGYGNWVGKNWAADPSVVSTPSDLTESTLSYTANGFTVTAPNDTTFLVGSTAAVTYRFQGSSDAITWTTLYTSATSGAVGQEITVDSISGTNYQYHRIDFVGDGSRAIAVAQLEISVSDGGANAE